jgi:hypothetical protein
MQVWLGTGLSLVLGSLLCISAWPDPSDPPAVVTNPSESPAVIVNPSDSSRTELARIVREAMHGAPVTLADDALTASNTLVIEHANPRDASGLPLDGRSLYRPERFELFAHGSRCVLVQSRTGRRWTLRHTGCVAIQVPKANIGAPIAHLSASKMKAAAGALGFALGIIDS